MEPDARTSHSLVAYRESVVLFGGAGEFVKSCSLRKGFNDLWIFDTKKSNKEWRRVNDEGFVPKKRMQHAAGVIGGVMLISAGYNTEARVVMDDFCMFDFRLGAWIPCEMSKPNGKKFTA